MRNHSAQAHLPATSRIAIFLVLSGLLCATEIAPGHSPRFSDYPFDQWASAPERATIKWDVRLLPPQLTVHQRLVERIQTVVPGGELAKRRGRGELVLLTRFEDSDGRQWRAASRLSLINVQAGAKSQELTFTTAAFIKPGDYKVLIALLDTQTMDHSFTRRTLHVAPLKNDPLPQSWTGLPSVEVLPVVDGPDAWFLPAIEGLLHLPLHAEPEFDARAGAESGTHITTAKVMFTERSPAQAKPERPEAARIDLLVNTTPSERSQSPAGTLRRNMSVILPALKVLSALNADVRPPSAAVIDVTRHRIGFETPNAARLDWNALDRFLTETNPGIIDAKSLSTQSSMRDYFAHEVARRARDSGPERWLIVLSGPLVFARQDDAPPPSLPADPRRHIVYMRFSPAFGSGSGGGFAGIQIASPRRIHGPMPGLGGALPGDPGRGRGRGEPSMAFPDDLERILKPMGAQLINISTPEGFRKSVAWLIEQISADD